MRHRQVAARPALVGDLRTPSAMATSGQERLAPSKRPTGSSTAAQRRPPHLTAIMQQVIAALAGVLAVLPAVLVVLVTGPHSGGGGGSARWGPAAASSSARQPHGSSAGTARGQAPGPAGLTLRSCRWPPRRAAAPAWRLCPRPAWRRFCRSRCLAEQVGMASATQGRTGVCGEQDGREGRGSSTGRQGERYTGGSRAPLSQWLCSPTTIISARLLNCEPTGMPAAHQMQRPASPSARDCTEGGRHC